MDDFLLFLTRNESIGDRIEFSIKKDIPIRFVKKLLEAKLPYHPEANTIEILWNDSIVDDNTMVYSLKDESSNAAYLCFQDSHSYKEWHEECKKEATISNELKEKILQHIQDNPPQRRHRFEFIVDRGDGEAERRIQQHGRRVFVINLSIDNLIHIGLIYYVIYQTKLLTKVNSWLKEKIGFTIYPFWLWLILSLMDILLPSIIDFMKKRKETKNKDMVDLTPDGILGDIWLCIYYFFATLLPFNWGPRVFRD